MFSVVIADGSSSISPDLELSDACKFGEGGSPDQKIMQHRIMGGRPYSFQLIPIQIVTLDIVIGFKWI